MLATGRKSQTSVFFCCFLVARHCCKNLLVIVASSLFGLLRACREACRSLLIICCDSPGGIRNLAFSVMFLVRFFVLGIPSPLSITYCFFVASLLLRVSLTYPLLVVFDLLHCPYACCSLVAWFSQLVLLLV